MRAGQGICTGCGVCSAVCPRHCIKMYWTEEGVLRPKVEDSKCVTCGKCRAVCPHEGHNQVTQYDLSSICGCYAGRFAYEVECKAASGGALTAVLCELLHQKIVDGIIHVKPVFVQDEWYAYQVSESVAEVKSGTGSAYCPVTLEGVLYQIRKEPEKRYAVVGLPCFISALHRLREASQQYRHQIAVLVGLVCGGMPSRTMTECLSWKDGKKRDDIPSVRYHIHDGERPAWNYGIELNYKDGTHTRSFGDDDFGFLFWHGLFSQEACLSCKDTFAEKADMVFMDAWLPDYSELTQGTSLFAFRNHELMNRLNSLLDSKNVWQMPISSLEQAQHALIEKRKTRTEMELLEQRQVIRRIARLCRRFDGDGQIIDKIRALEYTSRIKHTDKLLYFAMRLKQLVFWHI